MSEEDFGWKIDEPLEPDRPTPEKLRSEYPGLGYIEAEEIIFYGTYFGGDDIRRVKHLIYRAVELISDGAMTWNEIRWRWIVEDVSRLVNASKQRYVAVQVLGERITQLERQQTTSANTVSDPNKQKTPPNIPPRPQSPTPDNQQKG